MAKCKFCNNADGDYRNWYGKIMIPLGDTSIDIDLYTDRHNLADVWIADHQLSATGFDGFNTDIKMNYCPVCGRKLES